MKKSLFALLLAMLVLGVIPTLAQEATPEATPEATEAAPAFPVTIEHKFGSTTITEEPQRVVAIGFTDQDPLLALGVKPVAVRYWYGEEPNSIFPWAVDAADGAEPEVLNMDFGNLNYEAILALQPDLITAVYSGVTEEEYNLLSQIAPTIVQSADYIDFGMPWQETTLLLGKAVGKSEEAETLVADVETQIEDARAEYPAFEGKTIAVAYNYGGTYGFYTAQDPRGRFFSDLGFVVPDELVEVAGENFYANLSSERLELLDQDVLVFLAVASAPDGEDGIRNDPLISQLEVAKTDQMIFVPAELDDALQFNSVLSIPYLLEGLVPLLGDAVGEE